MINKIAKMRDSLFTKIVLTITALSFMSLFGVSGYYNMANSNKSVIKVDDLELSQSEFSYMLQRDFGRLRAAGFELDEDDDKKTQIANLLLQTKLNDLLLENTMRKNKVDISNYLLQQMLLLMPQFQNNGKFDYDAYKWYLSRSNKTEQELIQDIKRNVGKKILLEMPVEHVKVPEVLQKQMEKVVAQRRTFKYLKLENSKVVITRQPTAEELDQYYDDMSEELMIPEKRDISVLYLPQELLQNKIDVSQDEIDAYYKEHIDEYEQPAKRRVLQMVFDSEEKAKTAAEALTAGKDFIEVAEENGQKSEDVDLGFVGRGDVSEELAETVFSLPMNIASAPVKIADAWQILKVTDAKAAVKADRTVADKEIAAEIRQEKSYDGNYEIMADIEDKLGSETELEKIAEGYGANIYKATSVDENGDAENTDKKIEEVLKNRDVLENAFAYNEGESSQTIETDDGIAVVRVDKIYDQHKQSREDADAKLRQFWLESERASVIQNLLENIQHDLDAGDDLTTVARRYNKQVLNSRPVNRGETFDKLTLSDMQTLFMLAKNETKTVNIGDDYLVAETTNIYDDSSSLTSTERETLRKTLSEEFSRDMEDALLKGFSKDYKVEVNYKRMGLDD